MNTEFAPSASRNPIETMVEGMKLHLPKKGRGSCQWVLEKVMTFSGGHEAGITVTPRKNIFILK